MIVCYSACRIKLTGNNQATADKQYSDRSLIELRQLDFDSYSLRAVDVENNKTEIFNIPFKRETDYQRGTSPDKPDEVHNTKGTYSLWLKSASRTEFHKALDDCIQTLSLINESLGSSTPPPVRSSIENPRNDQGHSTVPKRPNKNDILVDVYELGHAIRDGDVEEAVRLSKILANRAVQLQASPWKRQAEPEIIPIRIRIDCNKQANSTDDVNELVMSVYPSTTIRELRAAFESLKQFPPEKQYFFVNGHLAHDDLSMTNLEIQANTLFIVFVI